MTNEALRAMALRYLEKNERTPMWLSRKWGVSNAFAYQFLKGNRNASEQRREELVKVLRGKAA